MREPGMKRIGGGADGIQVAVWEGEGRTVVCVHGLTANCRCWDLIAGAISPPHRVVAVDLRGRGLTGMSPSGCSVANHVEDIKAVLDTMGVRRALVMGHSLGALISLALAARYPDRVDGIVLIDGAGALPAAQVDKALAAIKPALDRLGKTFPSTNAYLDAMKQAPVFQPWSGYIDAYFRYDMEPAGGGVRSRVNPDCIVEEMENLKAVDVVKLYSAVSCPALILRATEGLLTPDDIILPEETVREMLAAMPTARRVDLPGANHYTIVFQPNPLRDREIRGFFARP